MLCVSFKNPRKRWEAVEKLIYSFIKDKYFFWIEKVPRNKRISVITSIKDTQSPLVVHVAEMLKGSEGL